MTTNPYAEAVGAGSVGLVEWLAAPAEVQGLTPADWLQARKMSEAAVAAAVGPLLAPIRALHQPMPIYEGCPSLGCNNEDCAELAETGEYVHLSEVVGHACTECRNEDGEFVWWTCPTTEALDAIEGGSDE